MKNEKNKNREYLPKTIEIRNGAENFTKGEFNLDTLIFLSKVNKTWGLTAEQASKIIGDSPIKARYYSEVVAPEARAVMEGLDKMDPVNRATCLYMSYAAEQNLEQALFNANSVKIMYGMAELLNMVDGNGAGDESMEQATEYDGAFYMDCVNLSLHYERVKEMAMIDVKSFETVVPEKGTPVWRWSNKYSGK